jgi:hypothetical protein
LAPPPQSEAEFKLPDFNSDNSDDSQLGEWNEEIVVDAEAEATEEVARWGEELQVHGDSEQVG